ncbi:MAG: hypothetical protein ACKVU4_01410 [Phycisphaerales bacterium]
MAAVDQVLSFLEQMGAARIPPETGARAGETLWRLGDSTLAVFELPGGVIRIDEVVIASRSIPHVLDTIGNLEARRIAEKDRLARPPLPGDAPPPLRAT